MHISGITYVKRKKMAPKLIYTILIILVIIAMSFYVYYYLQIYRSLHK